MNKRKGLFRVMSMCLALGAVAEAGFASEAPAKKGPQFGYELTVKAVNDWLQGRPMVPMMCKVPIIMWEEEATLSQVCARLAHSEARAAQRGVVGLPFIALRDPQLRRQVLGMADVAVPEDTNDDDTDADAYADTDAEAKADE